MLPVLVATAAAGGLESATQQQPISHRQLRTKKQKILLKKTDDVGWPVHVGACLSIFGVSG